jgi:hypothetical protein
MRDDAMTDNFDRLKAALAERYTRLIALRMSCL